MRDLGTSSRATSGFDEIAFFLCGTRPPILGIGCGDIFYKFLDEFRFSARISQRPHITCESGIPCGCRSNRRTCGSLEEAMTFGLHMRRRSRVSSDARDRPEVSDDRPPGGVVGSDTQPRTTGRVPARHRRAVARRLVLTAPHGRRLVTKEPAPGHGAIWGERSGSASPHSDPLNPSIT